jgi:hypothetical protein
MVVKSVNEKLYDYFFPARKKAKLYSQNRAASVIQARIRGIKTRKKFRAILNKIKILKQESMDLKNSLKKKGLTIQQKRSFKNRLSMNKFAILYYTRNNKQIVKYCRNRPLNKIVKLPVGKKKVDIKVFCAKKLKKYNKRVVENLQTQIDYLANLTGLYYTDYNTEKYREQYTEFYFNLLDPIVDYVTREKGFFSTKEDSNGIIMKLFKKFLQQRKDFCVVKTTLKINNYMHSNANVEITNRFNFDNEIKSCIKTGKKMISGFIFLEDRLEEDHGLHANTFIISLDESRLFRLEPNFAFEFLNKSTINKFHRDGLKYGYYPLLGYYDYTNRALYSYFKKDPLMIQDPKTGKDILIEFGGYYSSGVNECPYHGGLCMFISSLQTHLKRTVTVKDIGKYTLDFFKYYYTLMFGKIFDQVGIQSRLNGLFTFIDREYSTPKTVLKINKQVVKDYKDFKGTLNRATVIGIKIPENAELSRLTFIKPKINSF